MANPFKPEEKVLTKVKGIEVEATVRLVWKDEVQVRLSDGSLRWRTAKTVWPVNAGLSVLEASTEAGSTDAPAAPGAVAAANVEPAVATVPESTESVTQVVSTQEDQPPTQGEVAPTTAEPVSCGLEAIQKKTKRGRKGRR